MKGANKMNAKEITFNSAEEMLDTIQSGTDLWSEELEVYVFVYNDCGSICYYSIDKEQAEELSREAEDADEYWGAFLGIGGNIYDDPSDPDLLYPPSVSNIEFCNGCCDAEWIKTGDVIAVF